jgi:hypothetical protein
VENRLVKFHNWPYLPIQNFNKNKMQFCKLNVLKVSQSPNSNERMSFYLYSGVKRLYLKIWAHPLSKEKLSKEN